MNLKNNELMVIDMLVDYLIGDLVFVANENNILRWWMILCSHASQFFENIHVMNFS